MNLKGLLVSALVASSGYNTRADSHYLDNLQEIANGVFITELKASEKYVVWTEYSAERDRDVLHAYTPESKAITTLAETDRWFGTIEIIGENISWTQGLQRNKHFTWNASQGVNEIQHPCTQSKAYFTTPFFIAYECDDVPNPIKIMHNDGSRTAITGDITTLLGTDATSIFFQSNSLKSGVSIFKANARTGSITDMLYTSFAGNWTDIDKFNVSGNEAAWIIEEELEIPESEYTLAYYNGTKTKLVKRLNSQPRNIEIAQGKVYWNERNQETGRYQLHMWANNKGENILAGDSINARKFSVVNNQVYIADNNQLYQAEIKEFQLVPPRLNIKIFEGGDGEITVSNLVQGNSYTLEWRSSFNQLWKKRRDELIDYRIGPQETITFGMDIPEIEGRSDVPDPYRFYRVVVQEE